MFDLGVQELVVIFVVALLVFGPKRLPELARTMGKGIGQMKKAMFDIRAEVESEARGLEDSARPEASSFDGKASGEDASEAPGAGKEERPAYPAPDEGGVGDLAEGKGREGGPEG